jgi:hypothetical protein
MCRDIGMISVIACVPNGLDTLKRRNGECRQQ